MVSIPDRAQSFISHWRRDFGIFVGAFLLSLTLSGEALPPFLITDLEGETRQIGGASHTKAHVFVFILHDCPISNQYQPKIRRLAEAYASKGVQFHLVYADPDMTSSAALAHAKDFGILAPAYLDPKHALVDRLEAEVTPEAFVIDDQNQIQYRGRIDNLYYKLGRKRSQASEHDLQDALDEILAGSKVSQPRTQAIGCYIPRRDGS